MPKWEGLDSREMSAWIAEARRLHPHMDEIEIACEAKRMYTEAFG